MELARWDAVGAHRWVAPIDSATPTATTSANHA